jgi:hypothetical protein
MPNPVQAQFELVVQLPEAEEAVEIFIHNALGQMIYWEKVETATTSLRRQLHFGNEPAGVYFLSVQSPTYKQFKKFVKTTD